MVGINTRRINKEINLNHEKYIFLNFATLLHSKKYFIFMLKLVEMFYIEFLTYPNFNLFEQLIIN